MPDAVPVIDLAPFLCGRDCGGVARAIDAACRQFGFLMVTGHRVPAADIARMHTTAATFFDRPEDEKRRVQVPAGQIHGWTGAGRSRLADTLQAPGGEGAPPDLKETFSIGPLDTPPDVSPQEAPYFGRNLWPPQPAGLRDAARVYYRHMEILAATLMRAMAMGLDLEEHYFGDRIDRHITGLAVHHYPAQPSAPGPWQLRAGAHTDFGSLTILHPGGNPGGLQVWSGHTWIDVTPPADAFVINVGDLLAQWTNDRWRSTLHRVVNPPAARAGLARQSITFFHQPNWHTVVECLPGCGDGRYAPVTSGAHFEAKLARLRGTPPAPSADQA